MKLFRNIFSAILCFVAFAAHCQTISQDEALSRAKRFINSQAPASRAVQSATYTSVDNISDYLYVFNLSIGGWVIVSADKNNDEILGYNLSGRFDKNIPDNVNNVIKGYEEQIKKEIVNPTPQSRAAIAEPVKKAPVGPLCKTKWNQTHPYNLFCPEENGKKCYTGCVPTAMAQVMAYYKWPEKGHGYSTGCAEAIYEGDNFIGYSDTLKLDEIPIDWANMCNTYNGGETQAQKEAVATLMKLCGWTCDVSYHSSLSGSGASGTAPFWSLSKHFYYKGECHWSAHFDESEVAWHDYLYNTLLQKKPIIFEGRPNTYGNDGHEFICDGYDGKGYFHFNWGWAGSQDGFYKPKGALYTLSTAIVMEPDYDKKEIMEDTTSVYTYDFNVISDTPNEYDDFYKYKGDNDEDDRVGLDVYNMFNMQIGLNTIDANKNSKVISIFETDENKNAINLDFHPTGIPVSYLKELANECNFADGEYKCYPVYKRNRENEWKDVVVKSLTSPTYIRMLVENGDITFLSPNPADISVAIKSDRTICVSGIATSLDMNIYNTYGMRVYSGRDEEIKVTSPGIYTVVIGNDFRKTVVVK